MAMAMAMGTVLDFVPTPVKDNRKGLQPGECEHHHYWRGESTP